jgi:SnoaL-like domain
MPSQAAVNQLVALVEAGQFVEALETCYADDASMQENGDPPRVGLANLVAHERRVMAAFKQVHARRSGPVFIDGDYVVINWVFEFTNAAGVTVTLDELAHQHWRGDEVRQERFYYDPKQMRG